jgi:uncharacterized protein YegL
VSLETLDSTAFAGFFKWVSASVSSGSTSAGINNGTDTFPPPPEIQLVLTDRKVLLSGQHLLYSNVFAGRTSRTRKIMRRLPVFFVLDCSESMIGENLKK